MQAPSTSLLRAWLKPSTCCSCQLRQASNKARSEYVDPKKYHKMNALDKLHRRQKEAVRQESQSHKYTVSDMQLTWSQSSLRMNVPNLWNRQFSSILRQLNRCWRMNRYQLQSSHTRSAERNRVTSLSITWPKPAATSISQHFGSSQAT